MNTWSRRIGGALLMGGMWAFAWAPLGPLVGLIVDFDGSMDEPWIAVAVFPGFLCGALFSLGVWRASRRARFDELQRSWVVAVGAFAGLLVGVLPFVLGRPTGDVHDLLRLALIVLPSIAAMSALSAAISLSLARNGILNVFDAGPARASRPH